MDAAGENVVGIPQRWRCFSDMWKNYMWES